MIFECNWMRILFNQRIDIFASINTPSKLNELFFSKTYIATWEDGKYITKITFATYKQFFVNMRTNLLFLF